MNAISIPRSVLAVSVPFILISGLALITQLATVAFTPLFYQAMTIDLVLIIPAFYFILRHKTSIPPITVVPCIVIGIIAGSILIPASEQQLLEIIKTWVLPIIELGVVSLIIYKGYTLVSQYKTAKTEVRDFESAIHHATQQVLPGRIGDFMATEITVFYYALIRWRAKDVRVGEFTYHKKSSSYSLWLAFLLVTAIEVSVVHVLVARWSDMAAWIVSILSIYGGIQILAIRKSMSFKSIAVKDGIVYLHYGIFRQAIIEISNIETFTLRPTITDDSDAFMFSPLSDADGINLLIQTKEPVLITTLYGFKKMAKTIGIYADEPEHLASLLERTK